MQPTKHIMLSKIMLVTSVFISMLSLTACQTVPTNQTPSTTTATSSVTTITTETQVPVVVDTDYPIETHIPPASGYPTQPPMHPAEPTVDNTTNAQNPLTQQPAIQTAPTQQQLPDILSNNNSAVIITMPDAIITTPSPEDYMISPPPIPSHNELLERARQNSKPQSRPATTNNSELPAFQNLMQSGISQLKAGNLTAAESSFTRAQRLAPKSSAVYFYLAQVALKKNQPRKAEAMARRGLNVSQEASRRRALWQLILQSGQLQNNPRVIKEAQQALR